MGTDLHALYTEAHAELERRRAEASARGDQAAARAWALAITNIEQARLWALVAEGQIPG